MDEIINELPNTYQTPTMAPFVKMKKNIKLLMIWLNEVQNLKKRKLKLIIKKLQNINC